MAPKRPTPLNLTGAGQPPAQAPDGLIDAPEDLDFQPREFRLPESAGPPAAVGEHGVERRAPDLPALAEEARAGRVRQPRPWPFYLAATGASLLWALAPVMFAWGYHRQVIPPTNDPLSLLVLGLLAIGPMAMIWLAAYVTHQGARLAAETRRAQLLADTLLQPAALAARGAGTAVETVRREIVQATAAAANARDQMTALREMLAAESRGLVEATQASGRTAAALSQGLSVEREKMGELANALDSRTAGIADAITRHARMVAEASDLAETQIREAEAALAARAADLAAAAGEAGDAARIAGEDLSRQVARLETAGLGVGDPVRAVEETLTQQRAALVTVAHGLRADQEAFAAAAETHRAQLAESLAEAREGAAEIDASAARGADALRHYIAEAGGRLREIAEQAEQERDALGEAAARALGAVAIAAANERTNLDAQTRGTLEALSAAAETARNAAEAHVQIVRDKIDQLGEAAFSVGQRADAQFESRLTEARGLIEQSARLVDEAGARATTQLASGVAVARETLGDLERLLNALDERIRQLPADAEAGAQQVRSSLAQGMEALIASARQAAEETQSIDAAFQDRVRRNYDMLSEAVRLMGVVAGAASTSAPSPLRAAPPPAVPLAAPPVAGADAPAADDVGLRPRLRLTPTATDEEFKTVFAAAGGRLPAELAAPAAPGAAQPADGWTWKELLSSMDETPAGDENLPNILIGEIDAMGVDTGALLPRPRIDEIAGHFQAGQGAAVQDIVKKAAPAAIRRLARRLLADRRMRAQAERYVGRHHDMIGQALGRGGDIVGIVSSNQGRAFLLLDAALADVS
jgi:hypothetical protein